MYVWRNKGRRDRRGDDGDISLYGAPPMAEDTTAFDEVFPLLLLMLTIINIIIAIATRRRTASY